MKIKTKFFLISFTILFSSDLFAGYLYCITKTTSQETLGSKLSAPPYDPHHPYQSKHIRRFTDNNYEGDYAQLTTAALLAEKEWLGVINTYRGTPYLETSTYPGHYYYTALSYHYNWVGRVSFWNNNSAYSGKKCVSNYPVKKEDSIACTPIEISKTKDGFVALRNLNEIGRFCATLLELCQQSPNMKDKKVIGIASVDAGRHNPAKIGVSSVDSQQIISFSCNDGSQ